MAGDGLISALHYILNVAILLYPTITIQIDYIA